MVVGSVSSCGGEESAIGWVRSEATSIWKKAFPARAPRLAPANYVASRDSPQACVGTKYLYTVQCAWMA